MARRAGLAALLPFLVARRVAGVSLSSVLHFAGLGGTEEVVAFLVAPRKDGVPWLLDLPRRILLFVIRLAKITFYPEILVRNIVLAIILQLLYSLSHLWRDLRRKIEEVSERGRELARLRDDMARSETYTEFRAAQKKYMGIKGEDKVPLDPAENKVMQQLNGKVERYRELIRSKSLRYLQFELRSDLLRKHFAHEQAHPHVRAAMMHYVQVVCCAFGYIATGHIPESLSDFIMSKEVEDEHDVEDSLAVISTFVEPEEFVPDAPLSSVEEKLELARSRLEFFTETRHSFGRTALLLSGGAKRGLYHVGVIKELMEQGLLPRVISGSSAGSIVTAALGCLTDSEIRGELFDPSEMDLHYFGRSDSIDEGLQSILNVEKPPDFVRKSLLASFTNEDNGGSRLMGTLLMLLPPPFPSYILILRKLLPRWVGSGVLLDIDVLKKAVRNMIGDVTFEEAFARTGRTINITMTPAGGDRDVPLLCNFLTTPYVTVWSAVCASCCIPGVFAPVSLVMKTIDGDFVPYDPAGLRWIDGSLEVDLPIERLSEQFNINHHIVSQVNPHGAILAPHESSNLAELGYLDRRFFDIVGRAIHFCRDEARSWLKHFMNYSVKSPLLNPLVQGFGKVFVQKYSGDITLFPKFRTVELLTLLQNPTNEEYLLAIREGERMVWPKLQSIRRRLSIELMLDDCVHSMQAKITRLERQVYMKSLQTSKTMPEPSSQMSRVASYTVFNKQNSFTTEEEEDFDSLSPVSPAHAPSSLDVSHRPLPVPSVEVKNGWGMDQILENQEQEEDSPRSRTPIPKSPTVLELENKLLGRIKSTANLNRFYQKAEHHADGVKEEDEEEDEHELD